MDGRDFARGIVDDWDDPMPLDVFADWLEEQGQPDRAALLRAAADLLRTGGIGADATAARGRVDTCWEQCRPPWWDRADLVWADARPLDRGLVALSVSSGQQLAALGRVAWLPRAIAEGWFSTLTLDQPGEAMVAALVEAGDVFDLLPIYAHSVKARGAVLMQLLERPHLVGVELGRHPLSVEHVAQLGRCVELRNLAIAPNRVVKAARPDLFAAIGQLRGLRTLRVRGSGLVDDDLAALGDLARLRKLSIQDGGELSPLIVGPLDRLTGLRELICFKTPRLTTATLRAWRRQRPGLRLYPDSQAP